MNSQSAIFTKQKLRIFRKDLLDFKTIAREVRSWDKSKDKSEIDGIQNVMELIFEKMVEYKEEQKRSENNILMSLLIMKADKQYQPPPAIKGKETEEIDDLIDHDNTPGDSFDNEWNLRSSEGNNSYYSSGSGSGSGSESEDS